MATPQLTEVIEQADQLTSDEQLQLVVHLVERARQEQQAPREAHSASQVATSDWKPLTPRPSRRWSEIAGSMPYGLYGEDAQEWVSRTRREADDHRAALLDL